MRLEIEDTGLGVGSLQARGRFDIDGWLRLLLLMGAATSVIVFVVVALTRVAFPFDIDFVEDGLLMQALRSAQAQPVFIPPNADFVPHEYTPLYTSVGGLLFKFIAPSFAPLRLLSMGATLLTALLIYEVARCVGRRRWLAFVCAGLFLAGYRLSGGWYDLARVDALFVTLTLSGVACAIYAGRSTRGLLLAGLLLGLSFLTKQNGLWFGIGAAGYLLITVGRRAGIMLFVFALVSLTPMLILQIESRGWFSTYVFGFAYSNPLELQRLADTLRFEWFGSMIVLSLGFVVASIAAVRRWGRRFIHEQPWPIFIASAIGVSALGRTSVGGNLNNLMLGYAFLCLAPALVLHWIDGVERARAVWMMRILSSALLLQFALGVYNPLRFIPDEAMYRSNERLIERIASVDGEVLVMLHPFYALQTGKRPSAQIAAMWYARWRGRDPLPQDFVSRIENHYYAAIVSDQSLFETEPELLDLIEANYVLAEELGPTGALSTLDQKTPQTVIYLARR